MKYELCRYTAVIRDAHTRLTLGCALCSGADDRERVGLFDSLAKAKAALAELRTTVEPTGAPNRYRVTEYAVSEWSEDPTADLEWDLAHTAWPEEDDQYQD